MGRTPPRTPPPHTTRTTMKHNIFKPQYQIYVRVYMIGEGGGGGGGGRFIVDKHRNADMHTRLNMSLMISRVCYSI